MTEHSVKVDLGERAYDIEIGPELLSVAGERLKAVLPHENARIFVLSDETVWKRHGKSLKASLKRAGLKAEVITIASGEASKSFTNLERVLEELIGYGAERNDVLLAFGGGVVGDLTGLVAGLMKRGMPFVQMPTTLLAQVDSSVGGKTAINSSHGKNLIGLFNQPQLVLADISLLQTLPPREWRAGYAEVIKYGLIDDAPFFAHLETVTDRILAGDQDALARAVKTSCEAKARIVAEDETERGKRALLNLGHTFGHAIESARGYDGRVLHGEAVGTGMAMAFRYSHTLGLCAQSDVTRVETLLKKSGLSHTLSRMNTGPFDSDDLLERMFQDKKVEAGSLTLILAKGIGQSFVQKGVDPEPLRQFLRAETIM